ncbi:MAG: hypothetical protein ACTSRE_11965 [Promethearchaeota archaeon]
MAFGITTVAEFNTVITLLGFVAASVQAATGLYAAYYKKKISVLKTNEVLNRAHRTFGTFATTFYFLGLFQGVTGFIGALLSSEGAPAIEPNRVSFNLHVWISFPIAIILIWKTYISYFAKKKVYKQGKWLGMLTYIAWLITWVTSCIAFYANAEGTPWGIPTVIHEAPGILLPVSIWGTIVQIFIPFILGALISWPILTKAHKIELEKELKRQQKQ